MKHSTIPNQNRRSMFNLVIEPFKQIKFGLYMVAITIPFLIASGYILVNSFFEQYQHVLTIFNVVDPRMQWSTIADDIFYSNIIKLGICFIVFIFVLFFTIFKVTHRYYGPLVAINRFLKEIEAGNYSARAKIRENDDLQDLVKNLNHLAQILENRHGNHK